MTVRMKHFMVLIGFCFISTGTLAFAQVEINEEGVRVPGVEVNNEGAIKMPGVEIDEQGIRVPGVTIKSGRSAEKISGTPGKTFVTLDLRGNDFSGQDLSGALFESTDIRGANFSKSTLKGAIFKTSDIRRADFRGACLVNAQFTVSDLRGADFSGAILIGTKFSLSDMARTITAGAVYEGHAECPHSAGSKQRPALIRSEQIRQALTQSGGNRVDLTVNFETDSDKIKSEGHVQIFEIANALRSQELKNSRILIEGHTDSVGSDDYNLDLSYRRTVAVMRVLVEEYSLPSSSFSVKGYGEQQPVASNDSPEGRALNRRVTLVNLGQ